MVANVPMRGAVNVIEVTTIAPMTPPSQSQAGSRTLWPRLPKPWRATSRTAQTMSAAPIDPNAVASSTPIRFPNAPLTATWIEARETRDERENHRNDVADTAARITPGLGRVGQGEGEGRVDSRMALRSAARPTPSSRPAALRRRRSGHAAPRRRPCGGARIEDVDGHGYIDFAGGLGCQNAGHGLPAAVAAIHEQVDRYLHQCFMVGMYEPYVEVCRRLAELSLPRRRAEEPPLELGRRGGRERRQDRARCDRASGGRRLRPRLPRPDAPRHDDDQQGRALQARLRAVRARGLPRAARTRTAASRPTTRSAGSRRSSSPRWIPRRSPASCSSPSKERAGSSRCRATSPRLRELCDRHGILYVDDEMQGGVARTGPVWAIEHYGVEPDLLVSGQVPRRRAAARGRHRGSEVVDAVEPGGLGGTFGGNPVACAAAVAVLDEIVGERFSGGRASSASAFERRSTDRDARRRGGRGTRLGPMLALELVEDRETKAPASGLAAPPSPPRASAASSSSPAGSRGTSSASSSRS